MCRVRMESQAYLPGSIQKNVTALSKRKKRERSVPSPVVCKVFLLFCTSTNKSTALSTLFFFFFFFFFSLPFFFFFFFVFFFFIFFLSPFLFFFFFFFFFSLLLPSFFFFCFTSSFPSSVASTSYSPLLTFHFSVSRIQVCCVKSNQ